MFKPETTAPTANNSSQVQALAGLLKVHKVNFLTQKFVFLKKLTTFVVLNQGQHLRKVAKYIVKGIKNNPLKVWYSSNAIQSKAFSSWFSNTHLTGFLFCNFLNF